MREGGVRTVELLFSFKKKKKEAILILKKHRGVGLMDGSVS